MAISQLAICAVEYGSGVGSQRRGIHVPLLRCGSDQHAARGRTGFAVLLEGGPYAGAPACNLHTEDGMVVLRVDGRGFEPDFVPVRIEFFGKQHRQCSIDTLAHFRVIDDDGDSIIRPDSQERVGHEDSCGLSLRSREHVCPGK